MMAIIHIDGKTVEVDSADNLLQACLSLGIDVPYFCYHPALGSVGSCRQCAVKQYNNEEDYKAGRGRLVMSCMVAPTDNMYISVDDEEAKTFRKRIVEYLMTNHPHDCPTCEEGGHCHLQDMTYMSGHRARRYRFTKRTHHNQELGAFINHEMNRCIACYRCVRYYKDYAGGEDFGVYASNNRVYFGREHSGQFDSEFSGNLTEVCPTGVFTDKTHSDRYNRKWDMQYAPSVCHGCSSGCNISAGERYGELRRIENRYNHDVNGYFLCDRGRFGYGYVNRADRPIQPLENIDGKLIKINADFALDGVVNALKGKQLIGIGSATTSLENNFALKRLVGDERFSTGERLATQTLINQAVDLLRHQDVHNVSMAQVEEADAVFILGEDLTQTAPRVALSVRQSAKNKAKAMATALRTEHWLAEPVKRIGQSAYSPIYTLCVNDTKLDDIAKLSVVATPSEIAKLGYLVGQMIEGFDDNIEIIKQKAQVIFEKEANSDSHSEDDELMYLAHKIAYDLVVAQKPLVVSGTSLNSSDVIDASGYVATLLSKKREQILALKAQELIKDKESEQSLEQALVSLGDYATKTGVYMVMPSANSVGLSLLGGLSIEELMALRFDAVVILHHDLANLSLAQKHALLKQTVIVLDHESYEWHDKADFVLSSASFAEGDGTLVSAEGRAQRFFAAYDKKYYVPSSDIKDGWRWLGAIYQELHGQTTWQGLDGVIDSLATDYPQLALIGDAAPESDYRITGLKVAREPRRYSGRTSLRAKISIHEPMQPKDTDTPLTFSMEGYVGDKTSPSAIAFAWSAGWNSPQAWNKYQDKVGGKLKGGDVGIRLFDHLPKLETLYQAKDVAQTTPSDISQGIASLVPIYSLFGSSQLAYRSPVVASQMKVPVWLVAKDDATAWRLNDGDKLAINQGEGAVVLPVLVVDYLAQGCIGYPCGQVAINPYLPATVAKAGDVPSSVPFFEKAQAQLVGLVAPSLSGFNMGQSSERVS